jgi:uncharacterized membrane protein YhaH (DUF805 family)
MNFQEAIKVCFNKYADFTGTASRPEFWWYALFVFGVSLVASVVAPLLGGLFSLATLVPSLAVGARRLHDTQRSGWWQLIAVIPVVGFIVLLIFFAQESKPAA